MLKSYTVTFRGSPTERLSPHLLDEVKGLDNALTHALNLIRAGHQDVAIQDGTGKSVSGDLLMACCRGDKELTPDLFFAGGINASLMTLRSSGNGATSTAPTNCSVRLIHK